MYFNHIQEAYALFLPVSIRKHLLYIYSMLTKMSSFMSYCLLHLTISNNSLKLTMTTFKEALYQNKIIQKVIEPK